MKVWLFLFTAFIVYVIVWKILFAFPLYTLGVLFLLIGVIILCSYIKESRQKS